MLVVINYNMGNVFSVAKAFEYLGIETIVSNNLEDIKKADYLVLPGVGAFKEGMNNLKKLGLVDCLNEEVVKNKKPFLGICLGMQLLARDSEEFGFNEGLGWIDSSVKEFKFNGEQLKLPHVGWNNVEFNEKFDLFKDIKKNSDFYFVHSYHMVCDSDKYIEAWCDYGIRFVAVVRKDNIFATQFHPEKSQSLGLKVLKNFVSLGK